MIHRFCSTEHQIFYTRFHVNKKRIIKHEFQKLFNVGMKLYLC